MKIFITGGTGFVGRHLVEALRSDSHDVTILSRRQQEDSNIVNKLPKDLSSFDFVYHLAGILGAPNIQKISYEAAHVELTRQLTDRLEGQPFVFMSTAYVNVPSSHIYYVQTKQEGERIALKAANVRIVRPGFIYGPGDMHHYPLFKWIKRLGSLFPIQGDGNNQICPTYVDDVVESILPQVHQAGLLSIAGLALTMKKFIETIAETEEVGKPLIHLPPLFKTDFFCTEYVFLSDVQPTSLSYGLRRTIDWYRKEGLL